MNLTEYIAKVKSTSSTSLISNTDLLSTIEGLISSGKKSSIGEIAKSLKVNYTSVYLTVKNNPQVKKVQISGKRFVFVPASMK